MKAKLLKKLRRGIEYHFEPNRIVFINHLDKSAINQFPEEGLEYENTRYLIEESNLSLDTKVEMLGELLRKRKKLESLKYYKYALKKYVQK